MQPRSFLARATAALLFAALPVAAGAASAGEFPVEPRTVDVMKAVFGQVETRDAVDARARISGTIETISVEEGSAVTAGETIAHVVDDKLLLQRDAANAQIEALNSQLANARTELDRLQQLFATNAVARNRVDDAQTQVDVFANQLAAAVANRAVIEKQAQEGDVLAPVSGRALSTPAIKGSVVLAGDPVVRIAGGGYFLRLSLPERYAATVKEGSTVKVAQRALSSGDEDVAPTLAAGKLVKVYPEITDGRVTADVDVDGLGDYFVGERTLVWIPVGRRTVLSVPSDAVTTRAGVDYVRIAGEGGPIEVAVITGEKLTVDEQPRIEVLTGLKAGDRVLLP